MIPESARGDLKYSVRLVNGDISREYSGVSITVYHPAFGTLTKPSH